MVMDHLSIQKYLNPEPEDFNLVDVPDFVNPHITLQQKPNDVPKVSDILISNIQSKEEGMTVNKIRRENIEECTEGTNLKFKEAIQNMENDIIEIEDDEDRSLNKRDDEKEADKLIRQSSLRSSYDNGPKKVVAVLYKCRKCTYQTENEMDFRLHFNGHAESVILYHCTQCCFLTKRKIYFDHHLHNYHDRHKLVCSDRKLPAIRRKKYDMSRAIHLCLECNFQTICRREINSHMYDIHERQNLKN